MKSLMIIISLLGMLPATAQSIIGTWKRTSALITYKNGKSTDVQPMMEQSAPCASQITYSFTAAGVQKTTIPPGCLNEMSAQAALFADAKYQVKGSTVKIISPDAKLGPDATYTLSFAGNAMTWVLNFDDFPTMPNPGKAKSMTLTYKRL